MEIFQKTRIPGEKIFLIMPRPKNAVCSGDFLYSVSTQTQIRENGDFRQSRKASDKYKKDVFPGRATRGSRKTYPKTPRLPCGDTLQIERRGKRRSRRKIRHKGRGDASPVKRIVPPPFLESRRGRGDLFSALSRAKEASRRHALNRVFLFSHFAGEITFLPPIYGCNTSGIVTLPSACK